MGSYQKAFLILEFEKRIGMDNSWHERVAHLDDFPAALNVAVAHVISGYSWIMMCANVYPNDDTRQMSVETGCKPIVDIQYVLERFSWSNSFQDPWISSLMSCIPMILE
jgi:hypothetical protein